MSIESTLQKILDRIEDLDKRIAKIETRKKSHGPAPMNSSDVRQNLRDQLNRRIRDSWKLRQMPTELRTLSRLFGRAASKCGGMADLITSLEDAGKIARIEKLTGGMLLFPYEEWEKLSQPEIEAFQEMGLSEKEIARFKKQRAPSRAEMDAEAIAFAETVKKESVEDPFAETIPVPEEKENSE